MILICLILALWGFVIPELNALGAGCSWRCCNKDDHAWVQFKIAANRVYTNREEETERYCIFHENMLKIGRHNDLYQNNLASYEMGMNKFGDLTPVEFREIMFGSSPSFVTRLGLPFNNYFKFPAPPSNLDLRTRGLVTRVKDQGYTALGGLFAATGLLEGAFAQQTNKLQVLSEHHILNCASVRTSELGAFPFPKAMDCLSKVVSTAAKEYPNRQFRLKFPKIGYVSPGKRAALEIVLNETGPVAIQMPSSDNLQFYRSGLFSDLNLRTPRSKDFAALVVGYGTDPNDGDYWLVKNSWGEKWGEKGYIRIAKHTRDLCARGLAHYAEVQF